MKIGVQRLLQRYTTILSVGGLITMLAVLVADTRWISHPISTAILVASILLLRAVPVRLSKYSYLTQSAVPTLVGAVCVGPASVVVALWIGVAVADVFGLRKPPRAGLINAGREVLGFVASYGPYAAILALGTTSQHTLDFLPGAAILVALYFFLTRALFYFSLLVRNKLESAEKILILRWEISSYLLTLMAVALIIWTLANM
ncbi:MAG TPA: hypothetical protein VFB61_16550, partial [Gemmatimonadales bacterium]|nr:hypothetical protein [Gemmatimonadales bacterium]